MPNSQKLGDSSFDAALCALGLMYVPILKGRLANFTVFCGPMGVRRQQCGVIEANAVGPRSFRSLMPGCSPRCAHVLPAGDRRSPAARLCRRGFRGRHRKGLQTRLSFATGDEACEAAFAGGPVGLAYGRFSDTRRRRHTANTSNRSNPTGWEWAIPYQESLSSLPGRRPRAV